MTIERNDPIIRDEPVYPVRERAICPFDGAELRADSIVYASNPPRYPHKCPECGQAFTLDAPYPRIAYRSKQ